MGRMREPSHPTPPAGRPGRPARLSREQVLRTALALADAHGLEALTMRSIGQQLRAEAMSLYRHVDNKEDVLDGIVDLVFSEIQVPTSEPDWRSAMRQRASSARAVLRRHPWAIGLMESRMRPGPTNLGHHDAVLGILRRAGFSSASATHAYNLLDSYIYGFALQEHSLPFSSAAELADVGAKMLPSIAVDRYPNLNQVAIDLIASGFNYADEFEFGLDLILDALERLRRNGSD
jgi:AcrR family transcriptional regulator